MMLSNRIVIYFLNVCNSSQFYKYILAIFNYIRSSFWIQILHITVYCEELVKSFVQQCHCFWCRLLNDNDNKDCKKTKQATEHSHIYIYTLSVLF